MKKYIPFILAAIAVACEPTELDKGDAVLTTGDAVEITSSSACLCGEIVSSQSGTVWFELSENSEMSDSRKTSSKTLESVNHLSEVSLRTEKLSPNTTYYYRLCGKLDYDGYSMLAEKGAIRSFTTDKYPPAKAEVYVNTPSRADFVDYFVVENGDVMERSAWHLFDGYDSSRKMRYIKTTTAISDADIYMCQFTDTDLSDYRSVSFNLKDGCPFYYGHTTVSSMEPEAVCEMRPATCEVKFNVSCKSQNNYVDDGGIYQISLVNAEGGKSLPICTSATCNLSTGRVTGVTDAKAIVNANANIRLNSTDTQKASFPAVIPATAGEGEAELMCYVKSMNVASPIKVAMPAFEWRDGNTYTYNITVNYTPQTVELVIGSCTIEPWGEEKYMDDLSMRKFDTNGHEYVDLGLSVLWATCNLGADSPEDYGDYFAWGETEPYYETGYAQLESPIWKSGKSGGYSWNSYKYCRGTEYSFTKYCFTRGYGFNGFIDNKVVLDSDDDAACVNWGGEWRMPTRDEQDELRSNCTWTWTIQGGHGGYKVTSKSNGNSVFLPAAGIRESSSLNSAGSYGRYWSSSLEGGSINACTLVFSSGGVARSSSKRCNGLCVRPVCP